MECNPFTGPLLNAIARMASFFFSFGNDLLQAGSKWADRSFVAQCTCGEMHRCTNNLLVTKPRTPEGENHVHANNAAFSFFFSMLAKNDWKVV